MIAALVGVLLSCAEDDADDGSASPAPSTSAEGATAPSTSAAGTTAPLTSTEPALELPSGVTVFVEFPRYLQLQRRLEVAVDNASDTEVEVTSLALRSPLFEPVEAEERDTLVEIGRRRDMQIGLGPAVCPAPTGASTVEIEATLDGVTQTGVVEVDPAPLDRISAQECGTEFVLDHVDVGFSPEFTVADGLVDTTLDLGRTQGDDPITVTAVRGSVLIELAGAEGSTPLASMASGEDSLAIPVRMRIIRCDPHAVIESKKTFQLATWVAIGDREAQHIVISPEGELRAALEELIQECLVAETAGAG
jgi:hypothetical protein